MDQALDLGVEGDGAAAIFQIALQRAHERMTVDDAGLRRMQRRDTRHVRFHRARCRTIDHPETFDTVGLTLLEDGLHLRDFGVFGRDNQLAAFAMRHAMRGAEFVHQTPAARTMPRAQRTGRVVHAAVDHFAVA